MSWGARRLIRRTAVDPSNVEPIQRIVDIGIELDDDGETRLVPVEDNRARLAFDAIWMHEGAKAHPQRLTTALPATARAGRRA